MNSYIVTMPPQYGTAMAQLIKYFEVFKNAGVTSENVTWIGEQIFLIKCAEESLSFLILLGATYK